MIAERLAFAKVVHNHRFRRQPASASHVSSYGAQTIVTTPPIRGDVQQTSPITHKTHSITWLLPCIAGSLFAAAWALNAAPGIVTLFDDTLEFQLVLPTAGIAHPTGYPLYTLLGFLWSQLSFLWANGHGT